MKTVATKLSLIGLTLPIVLLCSCATTSGPTRVQNRSAADGSVNYGKATRHDKVQRQYSKSRRETLLRKAEELIEAGMQYYRTEEFEQAIGRLLPAEDILNELSMDMPGLTRRLRVARSYLNAAYREHSRQLIKVAKRQLVVGKRELDIRLLYVAERALRKARELDPNLRSEIDALIRRVQTARQDVRRELEEKEPHHTYQELMFGPGVYPGAKYWGLILVYAYA